MKLILIYIKRKVFLHWFFRICVISLFLIAGIVAYTFLFPSIIYINLNEIPRYLVKTSTGEYDLLNNVACPIADINNEARLINVQKIVTSKQLDTIKKFVSSGGEWMPKHCSPQHHTAIIVCYRNRTDQLQIFLYNIHSFLQKQNIHYQIYVIEQTYDAEFNRGKLFNVGYQEVSGRSSAGCYVFHDVDLIPENINNIYGCTSYPRHMSSSINIFNYNLPYHTIFGGAIAMTKKQYHDINGFSNVFYGWGGEDDDMFNRVYYGGYKVCRYQSFISRYIMLTHDKEIPNENRMKQLRNGPKRFKTDGLNSVTYDLIKYEELPLYTRILVNV